MDTSSVVNNKPVVNYEEVKAWSDSFNRLMQNPAGRDLLKQHLVQEHADENILFWEAVEAYKHLRTNDQMIETARNIYEQYVSSHATTEVSLDSKCRTALDKNYTQPNKNTFDDAQQHIYKLMETDTFERFKRSKIYMNFLLHQIPHSVVIGWGENFEKLVEYEEGQHLFEEFLINEKAEENLRFWLEVQDYKKCTNAKQRKARAMDIYNRFVNPDAKTEISLDSQTKTAIMRSYERGEAKLFEKAEEHIYMLMRNDCYPRFVKAPHYRNFLEMHKKNHENGQSSTDDFPVEEELH